MNTASRGLFRPAALQHVADRGYGSVSICWNDGFQPLFIIACMCFGICLVLTFVIHYPRVRLIPAQVRPSAELVYVTAPVTGAIENVVAAQGQQVQRGQPLIGISSDIHLPDLSEAGGRAAKEIAEQLATVDRQARQVLDELPADMERVRMRLGILKDKAALLDEQIALAERRLALAMDGEEKLQDLRNAGLVSELRMLQARDDRLLRNTQLIELRQSRRAADSDFAEAAAELDELPRRARDERDKLEVQASGLRADLLRQDADRRQVLVAPVGGLVAAVNASPGNRASAGAPLVAIIPDGTGILVEGVAPDDLAPHLSTGQSVAIRYHAFPYQRYGQQKGVVTDVARAPIGNGPDGTDAWGYRVTVRLVDTSPVESRLLYGISADIVADLGSRTLFDAIACRNC